jgi:adenylylsulfate kinase-like enzyme
MEGERLLETVQRALVYMTAELTEAGVPVVVDVGADGPWRDLARTNIAHWMEVDVDPAEQTDASVQRIGAVAARLSAVARSPRFTGSGCVVWITGLPGSGKTTIATAVAKELRAEGAPVQVIDLAGVRRVMGLEAPASPHDADVAHRTLAYTAAELAAAGVTAIVDATAPRRRWRELARGQTDRFVEVQLECPRHLCMDRERATRWTPWGDQRTAAPAAEPDIVVDYEPALRPELIVHTDTQTVATAAEDVVVLVRSLRIGP